MSHHTHLNNYITSLSDNADLREKVTATVDAFRHTVMDDFDYISDQQVLLYGDVQSGKTSHMLGIIADCLDSTFHTIVILTSPNTRLVQQTYDRVAQAFPDTLVCDRDGYNDFRANQKSLTPRKSIVVVGKIPAVLGNWLRVFNDSGALSGHPVLIIDDEADATSFNTKVNQSDVSTINHQLTSIRDLATGCIYLQVTGTPQAVLLQSDDSNWAAEHVLHFAPGESYIGGQLFFSELNNPYLRLFANTQFDEDSRFSDAIYTYLLTAALFKLRGESLCTMLIHPSHTASSHRDFAQEARLQLTFAFERFYEPMIQHNFQRAYEQLAQTDSNLPPLRKILNILGGMEDDFSIHIVNSDNPTVEEDWADGYNIIVGGNSLGRGLTFNNLQTVFYVRESKRPQADTLWQHARMFGYKRHKDTMRVFMPATIAQTFQEVYLGNEAIKNQLDHGTHINDIRVILGDGVAPTRANVLDKRKVGNLSGGVNYFAADPRIKNVEALDKKLLAYLDKHGEDSTIGMRAIITILNAFTVDPNDLDLATFKAALLDFERNQPHLTARMVLRTNRKVNQGTGALLSPTDQALSRAEVAHPLLILYRIEGVNDAAAQRGEPTWSSDPIWVPNIKLPGQRQFWCVDG
ncbi:stress-sensitive restriction system protein 2 [Corynebacterium glutamicum K051]|nr:stress-sensitive restriction system protein 2 [Corynebacterium glutamicum K051]